MSVWSDRNSSTENKYNMFWYSHFLDRLIFPEHAIDSAKMCCHFYALFNGQYLFAFVKYNEIWLRKISSLDKYNYNLLFRIIGL